MKKTILIVLSIIIIIGGSILYYNSFLKKNKLEEEKKVLLIYKGNNETTSNYYIALEKRNSQDTLIKEYLCQDKECKHFILTENNVFLYDGKYYLYNFIKDKKEEIKIDATKYKNFKILEIEGTAHGLLVYQDVKKVTYYSLKEQKLISKFIYNDLWIPNEEMLKAGYIFANKEREDKREFQQYVLEINSGKVMLDRDDSFGMLSKNGEIYYLFEKDNLDQVKVYNSKFKLLFAGKKHSLHKMMITDKGNLLVVDNQEGMIEEYNPNGKLVTTSDAYQEIFLISDNIICLVDQDGYLKAIDNKGKEITTFLEFTSKLKFHPLTSFIAKGKIQLVIEDTTLKEGNKGYCRSYSYELETKKSNVEDVNLCTMN